MLLSLVLDIKNNRQRSQGTGGPLTISSVLSAGLLKWLRTCGTDEAALKNLSWQTVLQPNKKVGSSPTTRHQWRSRSLHAVHGASPLSVSKLPRQRRLAQVLCLNAQPCFRSGLQERACQV